MTTRYWVFNVSGPDVYIPDELPVGGKYAIIGRCTVTSDDKVTKIIGYIEYSNPQESKVTRLWLNKPKCFCEPRRRTREASRDFVLKSMSFIELGHWNKYTTQSVCPKQKVFDDIKTTEDLLQVAEQNKSVFLEHPHGVIALHKLYWRSKKRKLPNRSVFRPSEPKLEKVVLGKSQSDLNKESYSSSSSSSSHSSDNFDSVDLESVDSGDDDPDSYYFNSDYSDDDKGPDSYNEVDGLESDLE